MAAAAVATPVAQTGFVGLPATLQVARTGGPLSLTISSRDRRSAQTLCWWTGSAGPATCRAGSGLWQVSLPRTAGVRTFVLRAHGRVTARKTVRVEPKA